jgi:excisionase family DNA binding protein
MFTHEVKMPSLKAVELAKTSSRALETYLGTSEELRLQIGNGNTSAEIVLPSMAAKMLHDLLVEIGRGNAVQLNSLEPEISVADAAELLNVSRPYVAKLIAEGTLSCRELHSRRLLALDEVMLYKSTTASKRLKALEELTALSQELGLYDEPLK